MTRHGTTRYGNDAVWYGTVCCSTAWYQRHDAVRYESKPYGMLWYGKVRYDVRFDTLRYDAV